MLRENSCLYVPGEDCCLRGNAFCLMFVLGILESLCADDPGTPPLFSSFGSEPQRALAAEGVCGEGGGGAAATGIGSGQNL